MNNDQHQYAADLLDAVALSVASGWGQRREYFDNGLPCCLLGHAKTIMREAAVTNKDVLGLASQAFKLAMGDGSVSTWNDQYGRTQDEVIDICSLAAAQLRQACG